MEFVKSIKIFLKLIGIEGGLVEYFSFTLFLHLIKFNDTDYSCQYPSKNFISFWTVLDNSQFDTLNFQAT